MKLISGTRKAEIASFSKAVRAAGAKLAPRGKDAERIRALARYLQAGEPAVKKWWYEQAAPRGGSAVAILAQLAYVAPSEDEPVEFDAAEIPPIG